MDVAWRLLAGAVAALTALLVVFLATHGPEDGVHVGAGAVALLLAVLGTPWTIPLWLSEGTADKDYHLFFTNFGLVVFGASLNALLLRWAARRRRGRADR